MEQREQILIGRISRLRIFTVPEFGTRASFVLERSGQNSVDCCVADQVARAFIASYYEGDLAAVSGTFEPRPSTASPKTPWTGRFRVRSLRGVERFAMMQQAMRSEIEPEATEARPPRIYLKAHQIASSFRN
jgi:hypothetical protein